MGVQYVNSTFIAVGRGGFILTSADGTTWTSRTTYTSTDLYDVTYGNSKFVAVGDSGTSVTSSDGVTWTATSNILHQSAIYAITSQ